MSPAEKHEQRLESTAAEQRRISLIAFSKQKPGLPASAEQTGQCGVSAKPWGLVHAVPDRHAAQRCSQAMTAGVPEL
jgi:hypothetical protein